MYFSHSSDVWREFPQLVAGAAFVASPTTGTAVVDRTAHFFEIAASRLRNTPESALPEIQAWRQAFTKMGLKPTQYRCAAESLLRRFRKEHCLPRVHPLVDLCNALSLAFAVPVAAFDVSAVADFLQVRHALGTEEYVAFSGEIEHPAEGEVIFADSRNRAHARRWTHRQSLSSAITDRTSDALIVIEGMHGSAAKDIPALLTTLSDEIRILWGGNPKATILTSSSPRFQFDGR